jgi:Protein of unknown function (DUF3667)
MFGKNIRRVRRRFVSARFAWLSYNFAMSTVPQAHCVGCGAAVTGRYCADCGEHTERHNYSMTHFIAEVLEAAVHVDGRVFGSFRSLLTQPGQLTTDFLAGRRKSQMGPVQMFVVCNVLYFLFLPLALQLPVTSTLRMQSENRPWRVMAKRMVDAKVTERHENIEEYAARFDEAAHLQGHSLLMLLVPLFAVGVWAVHPRARRYYAEHLVFSFYATAFLLLWMSAVTVPISQVFRLGVLAHWWQPNGSVLEATLDGPIVLGIVAYVATALRRGYDDRWSAAIVKAVLLVGWLAICLTIYRFILFFAAFYAT